MIQVLMGGPDPTHGGALILAAADDIAAFGLAVYYVFFT